MSGDDAITEVTVSGLEEALQRFSGAEIREQLFAALTGEMLAMERIVVGEKLSGGVLRNVTGLLRSSIHSDVHEDGDTLVGQIAANMGEARYAAFWEYGFDGVEKVREHLRQITVTEHFTEEAGKKGRGGRKRRIENDWSVVTGVSTVRAHERKVNQPARSYLRSTLEERREPMVEALNAAVTQSLAGA